MYLDPKSRIAGLPGTLVRDLLRSARDFDFNRQYAAARLKTSARRAMMALKELIALGYVEPGGSWEREILSRNVGGVDTRTRFCSQAPSAGDG